MSQNTNIGAKIKEIRNEQNLTLKQLSEKTGLSIGFLSQLERGLSNLAIDTLQIIAKELNVNISTIIDTRSMDDELESPVYRNYERVITVINPSTHSTTLSHSPQNLPILPREYQLMPRIDNNLQLQTYSHEGFEWIYVLEGILSVTYENQTYDLYPGDAITIDSTKEHNWHNPSNKITRFIAINTPNPLHKIDK